MNSFNQSESKHNSVANIARGVAVSFMAGAAALSLAGCNGNKTASAGPGNGGNQPAPVATAPTETQQASASDTDTGTTNASGNITSPNDFANAVKGAGWSPCTTDECAVQLNRTVNAARYSDAQSYDNWIRCFVPAQSSQNLWCEGVVTDSNTQGGIRMIRYSESATQWSIGDTKNNWQPSSDVPTR